MVNESDVIKNNIFVYVKIAKIRVDIIVEWKIESFKVTLFFQTYIISRNSSDTKKNW